jgi:tryptophan synthase alpha chain
LQEPAKAAGLDIIRLVTPTTDDNRLDIILDGASGFIYVVAIAGITGTVSASEDGLKPLLERIRKRTALPVAVGFGINSPADARAMANHADAVVVGSAIVRTIAALQNGDNDKLSAQIKDLSKSMRG